MSAVTAMIEPSKQKDPRECGKHSGGVAELDWSSTMCTILGCESTDAPRRGYCAKHYSRWRKYGDPLGGGRERAKQGSTPWQKIEHAGWTVTDAGCWEFDGTRDTRGYGQVGDGHGGHLLAHRVAFEHHHRPLDPDEIVRHSCDNPPCISPAHLLAGSHKDNTADMHARRRAGATRIFAEDQAAIRAARAAGVPAADIAARHGVYVSTIYAILRGERKAAI